MDCFGSLALFTDLYELTMAKAYHAEGMHEPAMFELGFRALPRGSFAQGALPMNALSPRGTEIAHDVKHRHIADEQRRTRPLLRRYEIGFL